VAGIEHDEAWHRRDTRDHLRKCVMVDMPGTVAIMELDAGPMRRVDVAMQYCERARGAGCAAVAMAAEVQHGG